MIRWWGDAGVERADFAVRRPCNAMLWHYDIPLDALPLSWARAENVRQADIYIRPARGCPWPLVLLDDVPMTTAARVARKYDALVVKTSEEGGCHLWLSCSVELDEEARCQAQRWLAQRVEADPASISGEHLGRLAGFKNWKRGGTWVNVLDAPRRSRPWVPRFDKTLRSRSARRPFRHADISESGKEWGWVCRMLEAGYDPDRAYHRLVQRARSRRAGDAERYARKTIARAVNHVRLST